MHRTILSILSFVVLFALSSCEEKEVPVTAGEATKLARNIELTIAQGSPNLVNNIIDKKAFMKKVSEEYGKKLDADVRKSIPKGLEGMKLGAEIIKSLEDKGSYKLVRQYEKAGRQHLLFRMFSNSGINYHDFELVRQDRQVKAADVFIYIAGESVSTLLVNTVSDLMAIPEGKFNNENALADLKRIKRLMGTGEYQEAWQLYEGLPEELRKLKLFMRISVQIAANLNDNELYIKSMEDFGQAFPNEKSLPLMMLDAYFLNGDYTKAMQAVNDLDVLLGTDTFLHYYRGLIYQLQEDRRNALASFETLYAYAPDCESCVLELIGAYIDDNDYDKACRLVADYRRNKRFDHDLLRKVLIYKDAKDCPEAGPGS